MKNKFLSLLSVAIISLNVSFAQPPEALIYRTNNYSNHNMKIYQSKTIVFITGAFVTNNCWNEWKTYFENKGYTVIIPAWPNKEASAEELRSGKYDHTLANTRLAGLTEYYENIVQKLPEKPILIGHSIGGLITQILLNRGEAAAGIAIHPLAPRGVITFKFSFLKAGWGPLGFFTSSKKPFLMSFKQWQYAFTNGMTLEQQTTGYYDFCTPESKSLVRDGLSKAAEVDFKKPHAPLLITSGSTDNFIPASLNFSNYKKYEDKNSVTDYKEFKGRNHFVLGQPTWKEDASYILDWIEATIGEKRKSDNASN
jgi:pimeloyl-ACP methyl ester carboxylesterase